MDDQGTTSTASDAECLERARAGDTGAFGELWSRHYRAGIRAARQFTSLDADDLVSEAFVRIYRLVLAGGGPTGPFRPYLYTAIRNLARSQGAASREVQVELMDELPVEAGDDPSLVALDRTLTASAFRSLPERWQTVLWYTEVEGMDPHEVAPLMGLTANGVAALSYRAREGLRRAWLQAHVNDATASGECRWARARFGEHARDGLGERALARMEAHLAECASCAIVSEEVDEVGSQLALVLLPLMLGGAAGGGLIALLAQPGPAASVADLAIPALPDAVEAAGAVATGVAGTAAGGLALSGATGAGGMLAGTGALLGGMTLVAVLGGGALLGGLPADADADDSSTSQAVSDDRGEDVLPPEPDDGPGSSPDPADPGGEPSVAPEGEPGDDPVGELVEGLVDDITGGDPPPGHTAPGGVVGIDLALTGTGTPGAHLSLQAAGQVYATTTIAADGTFVLNVTGLPQGISGLALVQTIDEEFLEDQIGVGGLLGGLLGTLEDLIRDLIEPLKLSSPTGGVSIALLTA